MASLLDKAIGYFSPEKALRRAVARRDLSKVEGARGYEGASTGRLAQGWFAERGDADAHIARDGRLLRERARAAVRNNPSGAKIVAIHANHLVGAGISPRPQTGKRKQEKEILKLFARWSKVAFSDGMNFNQGIYTVARMLVQDGEVYLRRRTRKLSDGLPVPMQIQVLEAEFCDWGRTTGGVGANPIVMGVEHDLLGRRRGYWMFAQHPQGFARIGGQPIGSNFVPAEDIVHFFEPQQAQVHGVTWLSPVLTDLKDLRDYELSETIRKKIEACAVGVVHVEDNDEDPNVGISEDADQQNPGINQAALRDAYGNLAERMEPGMFLYTRGGKQITFNSPAVSQGMEMFIRTRQRAIAAGARVTYEQLTGDYSQANFASGKLGAMDHQRFVEETQWNLLIPALDKVWDWFVAAARLAGKIPPTLEVGVEWDPPEYPSITRLDDVKADILEVRAGFRSPQQVVGKRGYDPFTVLDETDEWLSEASKLSSKPVFDSDPRKTTQAGQVQSNGSATKNSGVADGQDQ